MSFRQIAAAMILSCAEASFAAESPLEQTEDNSDTPVSVEIEGAESSGSIQAPDETQPSDEEESPSRFVPTEQISQDLGVSFPVDI